VTENRLQNCFMARSITYEPIRFAGHLSGAQCVESNDDGKQAVELLLKLNSPLGLNAHFSSVFLFVYVLQVLKVLYTNLRKLG